MKKMHLTIIVSLLFLMLTAYGCIAPGYQVENTAGRPTVYSDPNSVGPVAGVGIESQDVNGMCDQMMRDMMANPLLANASSPPRIIIDSVYFRNESSSRINLNTITDELRIGLIQNARGRIIFVGRHYTDMVEKERKLKSQGVVDQGTTAYAAQTLGADYRLGGRITSIDAISKKSGLTSRSTKIIFEMVDLQTDAIVWGGQYKFNKTAGDDVVYR
jgi:PBP1b-binding outer membrane lipoprotein LpoB